MKNFLVLLLVLSITCSFAACGGEEAAVSRSGELSSAEETSEESAVAAALPAVVGMTEEAALSAMAEAGYTNVKTVVCHKEGSTAGTVVAQSKSADGVYDSDPKKNPNAVKYDELTFTEVLEKDLKVMDSTAASMCRESKIAIMVFNIEEDPQNLVRAMRGEKVGTIVKEA